jgi:hypothetical protein
MSHTAAAQEKRPTVGAAGAVDSGGKPLSNVSIPQVERSCQVSGNGNDKAPIDKVLDKLTSAKKQVEGSGWAALCPAHDDKHHSLSVGIGDEGAAVLYCHAGCEFADIVKALGLEQEDLFPHNGKKSSKRRIVATYDYRDDAGNLLFQTLKYEPKDFRQRRPDGNGGWIWNLKDTPRVLYRLPELLAADPSEPVFVCEGEKSADAIRSLGLVATTSPLGARKWKYCDQSPLEGRKVAILPDDDPQGQNHALDVAGSLKDVAESRRIVQLPAVTFEKSDPADWVQAGGTRDDLLAILDQTPDVGEAPLFWDREPRDRRLCGGAQFHRLPFSVERLQRSSRSERRADERRTTGKDTLRDARSRVQTS